MYVVLKASCSAQVSLQRVLIVTDISSWFIYNNCVITLTPTHSLLMKQRRELGYLNSWKRLVGWMFRDKQDWLKYMMSCCLADYWVRHPCEHLTVQVWYLKIDYVWLMKGTEIFFLKFCWTRCTSTSNSGTSLKSELSSPLSHTETM